ncbi:MAG TPA: hypothetical protein V6C99_08090 [Oculatellaceae cyanobacterium]
MAQVLQIIGLVSVLTFTLALGGLYNDMVEKAPKPAVMISGALG